MEKKLSWFIYTGDYDEKIGGILVMHDLAKKLIELGDTVYMESNTPVEGVKKINFKELTESEMDNIIFVVSECQTKFNNQKKVVRWVLYKLGGFFGYKGFYPQKELVVQYGKSFTLNTLYENVPELTNFIFDFNLWENKNLERSDEDLILIKKGSISGIEIQHKGYVIDDLESKSLKIKYNDKELSELFNKHKRFITYDNETFHSIQAAISGCISIVIPDGRLTEEEWRSSNPIRQWGIAYGDNQNQIEFALSTVDKLKEELLKLIKVGDNQIKDLRKMVNLKYPDQNSITCIVATKWEKLFLLEQLDNLIQNENISQIIILDKNKKNRPSWFDFKNIEIIETELNTLPSYEMAVEKSINNVLMFISDDIKFESKEITKQILINKNALGLIAVFPTSFLYDYDKFGFHTSENSKKFHSQPDLYLEKLFFIKKENWINFPGLLEYGFKEWILKCHKPLNYFASTKKVELTDFDLLYDEYKKDDLKIINKILY